MFRGFAGQVDLNEQLGRASTFRGRLVESTEQSHAVYGMDPVECGRGFPCLVRLEMSDEMPADGFPSSGGFLPFCLLDLVFSQVV